MIAPASGFTSLVWLPAGFSLAALTEGGLCLWPGVAAGSLVMGLAAGLPLPVAGSIAAGDTLEALLGAFVLCRVLDFHGALDRFRDVLALALPAVLVSAVGAA